MELLDSGVPLHKAMGGSFVLCSYAATEAVEIAVINRKILHLLNAFGHQTPRYALLAFGPCISSQFDSLLCHFQRALSRFVASNEAACVSKDTPLNFTDLA